MAAYALSIYEFRGKTVALVFVIGTLLIPLTIILVPVFYVVANFGMINSLWGVIFPGAATPTGVFLLRQYMLTLPRELIEAARMDHASEWAIYWRVVLPLSIPAIAVLAIFSIMWRWNDFLWPLIVLSKSEVYTQIALNAFHGELTSQWNYVLAMTMVTLLPIAINICILTKIYNNRNSKHRYEIMNDKPKIFLILIQEMKKWFILMMLKRIKKISNLIVSFWK